MYIDIQGSPQSHGNYKEPRRGLLQDLINLHNMQFDWLIRDQLS